MCGIAGFVRRIGPDRDGPAVVRRMTECLRHRGPDGDGHHASDAPPWQAFLGHRRLSIIDLANGAQPLSNEDGTVWVTYNGEVYNYARLNGTLAAQGHVFRTRCDTETLVHLYEQEGVAGLPKLDGMFAFAVWDERARRLVLARDRVGIKPLYYACLPDGGLAFASELEALLRYPLGTTRLSTEGLASYFFADYALAPLSLVEGVHKLPPGHSLTWENGRIVGVTPFWSLKDVSVPPVPPTEAAAAAELRRLLEDAVRDQLLSDVPVGFFLSGGVDSSIVTALARRQTSGPLRTFSIGFEDARYDESDYARQVAAHLGTTHVERTLKVADLLGHVDAALDTLDEPMADPSIVPTFLLARLAAEHVRVVLGGDGGDELWAGYAPHKAQRYAGVYAALPRVLRQGLINPLVSRLPVSEGYQRLEWKAKRFIQRWDDDPLTRHMRWMSDVDSTRLGEIMPSAADVPAAWQAFRTPVFADPLTAVLALDFRTYLPGSVLAKVDRATMACGLEARPPLLHNALIDFAFSLPPALKMRRGRSKYLLKRVAADLLPEGIVHRKKKGFGIPLAEWLRGPLRERMEGLLAGSPAWDGPALRPETFRLWWRQHLDKRFDHSKTMWALLVLDHWMRKTL